MGSNSPFKCGLVTSPPFGFTLIDSINLWCGVRGFNMGWDWLMGRPGPKFGTPEHSSQGSLTLALAQHVSVPQLLWGPLVDYGRAPTQLARQLARG
jgi:hypothetical protein